MTAVADIAAIDDGGVNTAAEVRAALTSVLTLGSGGITLPPASGWSWVNQGSATETVLSDGQILLAVPATGANSLTGRIRSYTAPQTLTAKLVAGALAGGFGGIGLWCRESSTGKLVIWHVRDYGAEWLGVENWTNPTTYSSQPYAVTPSRFVHVWLEIEDNNTNLIFKWSPDGQPGSFITATTISRTAFLAGGPDEWGWYVRDNNVIRNGVLSSLTES